MKRLDCLDGLRGLLALYVLLGHMAPFAVLPGWVEMALSHGAAAVDLFFVLSGLVIVQSLDRWRGRAWPFLVARAARIFPVFLPVFALSVLVQPVSCGFDRMPWLTPGNPAYSICTSGWPAYWWVEIAAHLSMTHGLFPDAVLPDVWVSFLGSAWSLSTEWQLYALALLVRDRSRLIGLLLALAVAGAAWRLFGPDAWQFSRAFLPNQAQFFALGVASVGVVMRDPNGEPTAGLRFALVLAFAVGICATHGTLGKLLPPLAWSLCLGAQRGGSLGFRGGVLGPLRALLRLPVCIDLGAISYCVYLVNEPVQKLLGGPVAWLAGQDGVVFSILWIPLAIGLPLAVSAALHVWLEKPALRWGRSLAAGLAIRP